MSLLDALLCVIDCQTKNPLGFSDSEVVDRVKDLTTTTIITVNRNSLEQLGEQLKLLLWAFSRSSRQRMTG